jgi:bifunctional non-homologous end joining protein LigD
VSLVQYREKRHFKRTPEPAGRRARGRGPLRFVVQKHHASRLHYDFRLELGGTLKSWAVPKGPSLDPADRRLAMMVEDHPLEYRSFEGTIPEGNYGAGTVIVWDHGTYHAAGTEDRKASEKLLAAGLAKGRLDFVLAGEKLNGAFSLVRLRRGEPNAWLLLKRTDSFAVPADVTDHDRSVVSGRTLADLAESPHAGRTSRRRAGRAGKGRRLVRPMLATLVDAPFDRPGWLFEVKWDGYRAIAEVARGGGVRLYSRNHNSFDESFAPVARALAGLGRDAVLDGEVVAVDAAGRSGFQLLQNYQKTGKGDLLYVVFDLLSLDGADLRDRPLVERKKVLRNLLPASPRIRYGDHIEESGTAFFRAAVEQGLEGIIGKDGASRYVEGARSPAWVKVKTRQRQEAVIGGFTAPRGRRVGLGALVLGVYEGDELVYIGHTGGGLDTRGLTDLTSRLTALETKTCPFRTRPRTNAPVRWVEPTLVCEVAFQEWTHDGRMRQPIFVGLREDKPPSQVRRELPAADPAPGPARAAAGPARNINRSAAQRKPRRRTRGGERPSPLADGPPLTNLGKVYWPAEGYTKGDLIAYYREVAPVILPYLRDRPMSLHRHPDGIGGGGFFQKDVGRRPPPDWVRTVTVANEARGGTIRYVVCDDEATLLYLANLGCIELNPWNARAGDPERPDWLVIDLDPEGIPFARVVEAALVVRKVLDRAGAESVVKTSGKRGLHLCVPLGARYDHDQARQFAELVAAVVNRLLPRSTSLERSPAKRQRRVYLDYLQNRRGQTLAAPYSVRPAPRATVSTPLRWGEVRRGLDPSGFTIRTTARRLDTVGDLWTPVLGPGPDLLACLSRLEKSIRAAV